MEGVGVRTTHRAHPVRHPPRRSKTSSPVRRGGSAPPRRKERTEGAPPPQAWVVVRRAGSLDAVRYHQRPSPPGPRRSPPNASSTCHCSASSAPLQQHAAPVPHLAAGGPGEVQPLAIDRHSHLRRRRGACCVPARYPPRSPSEVPTPIGGRWQRLWARAGHIRTLVGRIFQNIARLARYQARRFEGDVDVGCSRVCLAHRGVGRIASAISCRRWYTTASYSMRPT